jgi:hypothetical protein
LVLLTCKKSAKPVAPILLALPTQVHQYNGAALHYYIGGTNSIGANARKTNGKSYIILIRSSADVLAAPIMYSLQCSLHHVASKFAKIMVPLTQKH